MAQWDCWHRVFALSALFSLHPLAHPCFCAPSPSRPCQTLFTAQALFTGRVIVLTRLPGLVVEVQLDVLEASRGVSTPKLKLTTSTTSCGVKFQTGMDYFVQAWPHHNRAGLETGACSLTALVSRSAAQIETARNLASGRGPASLFGFATSNPTDLRLPFRATQPRSALPIHLSSGNSTWNTLTDAHGNYEFNPIPAGAYTLSAPAAGLPPRTLTLGPGECHNENLLTVETARIAGLLLDSDSPPCPTS